MSSLHAFFDHSAQCWTVVQLTNTAEGVPSAKTDAERWAEAAADPVWRKEMDDFLEMVAESDAEVLGSEESKNGC